MIPAASYARRHPEEVSLTGTLDDLRFNKPLYTVSEAAAYVGVPRSTFATRVHGYVRTAPDKRAMCVANHC